MKILQHPTTRNKVVAVRKLVRVSMRRSTYVHLFLTPSVLRRSGDGRNDLSKSSNAVGSLLSRAWPDQVLQHCYTDMSNSQGCLSKLSSPRCFFSAIIFPSNVSCTKRRFTSACAEQAAYLNGVELCWVDSRQPKELLAYEGSDSDKVHVDVSEEMQQRSLRGNRLQPAERGTRSFSSSLTSKGFDFDVSASRTIPRRSPASICQGFTCEATEASDLVVGFVPSDAGDDLLKRQHGTRRCSRVWPYESVAHQLQPRSEGRPSKENYMGIPAPASVRCQGKKARTR
eukprot:759214-Hanusia_phi.AAC.6